MMAAKEVVDDGEREESMRERKRGNDSNNFWQDLKDGRRRWATVVGVAGEEKKKGKEN
uniref:Uncharacterized protein n=1 Tax=Medicago truncatula TaxID=3880 RepID=Q2HSK4_MEDTR|nr:hypothetical protein MtrDRAFT_AC151521g53v2 [Medicago truncatula]